MAEELSSEQMANLFMNIVSDRYPSVDKVLRNLKQLSLPKDLHTQIIMIEHLRDAIRQVDPHRIYRSTKHRHDVERALLLTLEELYARQEEGKGET